MVLAWRLVYSGEQGPHHDDACAGGDGLGDVAGVLDATVCDDGDAALAGCAIGSAMAVIWGLPAPVTIRVVQMLPGPIPTLMASAPASMRAIAPS